MKKAQFFVDEFIRNILPEKSKNCKKEEWKKIQNTVFFVKNVHEKWRIILLYAINNARIAEKLAQGTSPVYIQDDTFYVKVTNTDETMLISLHAKVIILRIQNTYVRSIYSTLSEKLTKLKPIYYLR